MKAARTCLVAAATVLALGILAPAATTAGADGAAGVAVLDASGAGRPAPCGPVSTSGRFVDGGCPGRANSLGVTLEVRTVFGVMPFGECGTDFDLTLSRDGRIWFDDLRIGGPAPCSDIWPCAGAEAHARRTGGRLAPPPPALVPPWRGRIEALPGGGFGGSFRLCIDTCLGRYAGDVAFRLVRGDAGWIMRTSTAGVGEGGLQVTVDWNLIEPADFDLARRR